MPKKEKKKKKDVRKPQNNPQERSIHMKPQL